MVQSIQKLYLSKSKHIMLEYYQSRLIDNVLVSKVQVKVNYLHSAHCIIWVDLLSTTDSTCQNLTDDWNQ